MSTFTAMSLNLVISNVFSDWLLIEIISRSIQINKDACDENNCANTNYALQKTVDYLIHAAKLSNKSYLHERNKLYQNLYIPCDEDLKYHPEYDWYTFGTEIKQADVAMFGYLWDYEYSDENVPWGS